MSKVQGLLRYLKGEVTEGGNGGARQPPAWGLDAQSDDDLGRPDVNRDLIKGVGLRRSTATLNEWPR